MTKICFAVVCGSLILFFAGIASAHPGRLDKDGCHHVSKDWKYKSGKELKAGTYHCHRGLGAMKLDGSEMIDDPEDVGEEADACRETSIAELKKLAEFFGKFRSGDLVTVKMFQQKQLEIVGVLKECR